MCDTLAHSVTGLGALCARWRGGEGRIQMRQRPVQTPRARRLNPREGLGFYRRSHAGDEAVVQLFGGVIAGGFELGLKGGDLD